MKQLKLLLILIFVAQAIIAQKTAVYATIDQKALQIPDSLTKTTDNIASYISTNFKTDLEKTRAIFIWVATNIQYDVKICLQ